MARKAKPIDKVTVQNLDLALRLTATTLDRAITQKPCYVPLN